jgi:hypothetical protein
VINKDPPAPSPETAMAAMQRDADERAGRRRAREATSEAHKNK